MIALGNGFLFFSPFLELNCELQILSQRASEEANLAEESKHRTIHALPMPRGRAIWIYLASQSLTAGLEVRARILKNDFAWL